MSLEVTSNIIAARKRNGITQKEMANKLGVSQAYYSKLEKRNLDLSINQIQKIADGLGVRIEEIISISIKGSQSMSLEMPIGDKDYMKKIEEYSLLDQGDKLLNSKKEALFNLLLERVFFNLLKEIESKIIFDRSMPVINRLFQDDSEYIEKILFEEFVSFGYPSVLTPKEVLILVHEFVVKNQISFRRDVNSTDGGVLAYKFHIGRSGEGTPDL